MITLSESHSNQQYQKINSSFVHTDKDDTITIMDKSMLNIKLMDGCRKAQAK